MKLFENIAFTAITLFLMVTFAQPLFFGAAETVLALMDLWA